MTCSVRPSARRTVRYEGADVTVTIGPFEGAAEGPAEGPAEGAAESASAETAPLTLLSLLDVVRRELGVRSASAPSACSDGKCGACRLIVDGELVNACTRTWAEVREGATIEAYEQLATDEAAARAVAAFGEERPTRCRLCIGGLGVTAAWLARQGKPGDAEAVEHALESATCMCTGRGSLRRALLVR